MEEPLESFDFIPEQPKVPYGKVILVNFVILLAFILLIDKDPYAAGKAFLIVIQVFLNIISGAVLMFTKHKPLGKAMLLSAVVVLILGFGMCLAKEEYFR